MNEILESFVNKKICKIYDVAIIEKNQSISSHFNSGPDVVWFKYEPMMGMGIPFKDIVCYNKEKNFFETESFRFLIQAPLSSRLPTIDWEKFEKLYEENRVKENL
jgi:hypothetical protein